MKLFSAVLAACLAFAPTVTMAHNHASHEGHQATQGAIAMDHSKMDHSKMDHAKPVDHSKHDAKTHAGHMKKQGHAEHGKGEHHSNHSCDMDACKDCCKGEKKCCEGMKCCTDKGCDKKECKKCCKEAKSCCKNKHDKSYKEHKGHQAFGNDGEKSCDSMKHTSKS